MKKYKKYKKYKKNKGFTLIELLVAIAIFSIIITAGIGIFISSLKAQRKALATQEVLDQTSYVFEYMSRALRMASKETLAPACLSQNGFNYELSRSGTGIMFRNNQGICQEFFLEQGKIKQTKGGIVEDLTSDNIEITSLKFNIMGESETDIFQPRATMSISAKGRGQKSEAQTEINLQTTVSQRNLDQTSSESIPPPPLACEGAPNTGWGSNLYDCTGSDKRCYNGSCITCSGWMNLGYCWHNGGNAQSCTTVCGSYGGTYPSDCGWPYDAGCSTCLHFYPGQTCLGGSGVYGPCFGSGQGCFYGSDNPDKNCNAGTSTLYRQCGCNQ